MERYPTVAALVEALQAYLQGTAVLQTSSQSPVLARPSRRKWQLLAGVLLAAGGITAAVWGWRAWAGSATSQGGANTPAPAALTGQLEVLLWSATPDGPKQGIRVQDANALPAKAGERVQIRAKLNTPAYVYLVLIDSQGQAVPLAPWNPTNKLAVKHFLPLPANLQPTTEISSPPNTAMGWPLNHKDGLETILLLARRTPLDIDLGPLLANMPAVRLRNPEEVLERGSDTDGPMLNLLDQHRTHRGFDDDAAQIDEPLLELLQRLRPHFDLIRAVRFAHQGK